MWTDLETYSSKCTYAKINPTLLQFYFSVHLIFLFNKPKYIFKSNWSLSKPAVKWILRAADTCQAWYYTMNLYHNSFINGNDEFDLVLEWFSCWIADAEIIWNRSKYKLHGVPGSYKL